MGNLQSCFKNDDSKQGSYRRISIDSIRVLPAKEKKARLEDDKMQFFTNINCGGENDDHDSLSNVTVYGPLSMAKDSPSTIINGNNQQFKEHAKSFRWAAKTFGYNVQVPRPGTFKVTLIFCEIDKSSFATGKRVFSASVFGNERVDINDIDVFSKSGKNSPYILKLDNVIADSRISVILRKGKAGYPFISGISVQAVKWTAAIPNRPAISEPNNSIRRNVYVEFDRIISQYIDRIQKLNNQKLRTVPSFMFHQSETKVRGLIVTFHSFSSSQYEFRIFNRYVHKRSDHSINFIGLTIRNVQIGTCMIKDMTYLM